MEKKTYIILGLIVVLAFVLRFVGLTTNPPSLNWDEVSHGYNAYSVLKTGADEWSQKLPIANFRAYGDYPLPLNLYLTIPFIVFLGLTEFAIRLPHVILGALTVISTFFIAWGLTKNKNISLLSAFLVAISPWTLFTSRFVLQSNLSIFLLSSSLACFVNRDYNKKLTTISFLLLGLSLFAYNTTRIVSPLILIIVWFLYRSEKIWSFKNRLILSLFFIPLALILLNNTSYARSFAVAIIDQGAINKIETLRNESSLPNALTKAIYNRPVYFAKEFIKNYLDYFSPNFLFFKGGTQYQFSIPNNGLIPWINLPFFYIGLILLIFEALKKNKSYLLILFILAIAPIPAAMTNEKFAVLRSSAMVPIPMILSAMGYYYFFNLVKDRYKIAISFIYFLTLVLITVFYLKNYFTEYRINYSKDWQYGYKEVTQFIKENEDNYAKIIITKKYGEPHEFLLFYLKYDPTMYKNDKNLVRFYQTSWWWVDGFSKYYFVNDWQIPGDGYKFIQESKKIVDCKQAKCLLITSLNNAPKEWQKIKTINFLDGQIAFELYENN